MFQINYKEVRKAAGSAGKKALRRSLAYFYQTLALAQTRLPDGGQAWQSLTQQR